MKEYKIPISQAKTLYEPKEAYSTKLKTTYGKTTTIPYLSERTGNNTTKLRLLQQDLYDSCGGESKPNIPSVPVNNTGNLDIMTRISSIAGGSIMTYVGAVAIITGATALTIATGGAGLPALIAATVAAGTMVSGAGLAVMGVNEIAYGATGENVLLNNVFKGNTDLYSNTQLALTMGAIGGTQYSSAYSYQETVFRNGTEGGTKSDLLLNNNVGVRIDTVDDLADYGKNLGKDGQLFLTNKEALKGLDLNNTADLVKAEKILGLPSGRLTNGTSIALTEINLSGLNVRLPSSGNEFFIPGGFTSGGAQEIIVDSMNIFADPAVTSIQFYHN